MFIKTGEKVNVAVRGGVSGNVVGVENSENKALYTVKVDNYNNNFIVPESMIATYGVGQTVRFYSSPKKEWRVQGKIKEIKYNVETGEIVYSIEHEIIERFNKITTPIISEVSETYVIEALED